MLCIAPCQTDLSSSHLPHPPPPAPPPPIPAEFRGSAVALVNRLFLSSRRGGRGGEGGAARGSFSSSHFSVLGRLVRPTAGPLAGCPHNH